MEGGGRLEKRKKGKKEEKGRGRVDERRRKTRREEEGRERARKMT